ncbi:MAG: hypothetical protein WBN66_04640 [Smithella sp.]
MEIVYETILTIIVIGFCYFVYQYNKKNKKDIAEKETIDKTIICPNVNCGYKGEAKKIRRGSTLIGLILCLFFLIPGIIYFIIKSGYRYTCPKCGLQIRTDN